MWNFTSEILDDGQVQRFKLTVSGTPISYAAVLQDWQHDEAFTSSFGSILANSPFEGFRWETPPITRATAERPFEFVLIDDPALNRPADARAFKEQLHSAKAGQHVVAFPNLGNDAVLVVPCASTGKYAHIGAFVRTAPAKHQQQLWRVVGSQMQLRLGRKPYWLSTAGMGVPWLHVRLDSRPKYYAFDEYREGQ